MHCSSSDSEILVKCFLEEDMLRIYNRVDSEIKGYPAKLRKAFTKESNLLEDMRTALVFKQRDEDPIEFFEKVEKLADKVFTSKLTRETFIELLLVEASKEKDLQRQLIMSNTVGIEGVKEKIEKLHLVKLKTETEIMAIRTGPQGNRNYAEAVRGQHYTQNTYSLERQRQGITYITGLVREIQIMKNTKDIDTRLKVKDTSHMGIVYDRGNEPKKL